jgi:hypothetical protein
MCWLTVNVFSDSVVGVATSLRAERSGIRTPAGARVFLFSRNVHTGSGPHEAHIQWVSSVFVRVVKLLVCESDNSAIHLYSPPLACCHDVCRENCNLIFQLYVTRTVHFLVFIVSTNKVYCFNNDSEGN